MNALTILQELLNTEEASIDRKRILTCLKEVNNPQDDKRQEFNTIIVEAFNALDIAEPTPEWFDELVELATQSQTESVFIRSIWKLEAIIFSSSEYLDKVIFRLRSVFEDKIKSRRLLAVRTLLFLSVNWPEIGTDLNQLLEAQDLDASERASVLLAAGRFKAIPEGDLASGIDRIITSHTEYDDTIAQLVAFHGRHDHWERLAAWYDRLLLTLESSRLLDGEYSKGLANIRQCLGYLIRFSMRHRERQAEVVDRFVSAPHRGITFGWEHYIQDFFDSPLPVDKFVRDALSGFTKNDNTLNLVTLVKHCNRPSHLDYLSESADQFHTEASEVLRSSICDASGSAGIWATMATRRKESALTLATRLGLSNLLDWESHAVATEEAPFLLQRLAEDCMFWDESAFVEHLKEELRLEGEQNPSWLINKFVGFLDPKRVFDIMLDSDGRHGMQAPLQSYVYALGYLAVAERDCARLTTRINSASVEDWRRHACAGGIRHALTLDTKIAVDLDEVLKYVLNESNPVWSRDELAISLAHVAPDLFREIALSFDITRLNSSRMMLACTLTNVHINAVLERLSAYSQPPPTPYTSSFEYSYAALIAGHLYNAGVLDQTVLINLARNGLRFEFEELLSGITAVRTQDQYLRDEIWNGAMRENISFHSVPSLWFHAGRLVPDQILHERVLRHVATCSSHSVKSFMDMMIKERSQFQDCEDTISSFLIKLSLERDRAVGWYAAWVASVLVPNTASERIQFLSASGDSGLRNALEHAFWCNGKSWDEARERCSQSRYLVLLDYVEKLQAKREQREWVSGYLDRIIVSSNLLDDWKYVQAIMQLPNEEVLLRLAEYVSKITWKPENGRLLYLIAWIAEKLEPKLKKQRENLFQESRLPGDDAFPRWF